MESAKWNLERMKFTCPHCGKESALKQREIVQDTGAVPVLSTINQLEPR